MVSLIPLLEIVLVVVVLLLKPLLFLALMPSSEVLELMPPVILSLISLVVIASLEVRLLWYFRYSRCQQLRW